MTEKQKEILRKIIYAVETGGQVYGQARYDDFTEAYTNSSAEHAITIGAGQWYATEALTLLKRIRTAGGQGFTQELLDVMEKPWSTIAIRKTSSIARAIVTVITTDIGKACQDMLMDEQMEVYTKEAFELGVTSASGQAMCANFRHQGGYGAMKRIINKTSRPYTLDNLYQATLSDTGNQVGAYRARQRKVYEWLKKYMEEDSEMPVTYKSENEAKTAVLDLASNEVGYLEKASAANIYDPKANPGSGNHQKYGYELHALQPSNMDYPAAWCDAFVDWLMYKCFGIKVAKLVLCGDFDDYTVTSANYYKQKNRWTKSPASGYQIFFQNITGICHTGIVVKVSDGYVYTIEGNKNNAVRRCQYRLGDSSIAGYGMPRYDLAVGLEIKKEAETVHPMIAKGSAGDSVRELQTRLNYIQYGLAVDGDFGSKTQSAVKDFQKKHGLEVDGIVGPKTWAALLKTERKVKKTPGIIRKKPTKKSGVVTKLSAGNVVYILEIVNGWALTTGGGYIIEENLI